MQRFTLLHPVIGDLVDDHAGRRHGFIDTDHMMSPIGQRNTPLANQAIAYRQDSVMVPIEAGRLKIQRQKFRLPHGLFRTGQRRLQTGFQRPGRDVLEQGPAFALDQKILTRKPHLHQPTGLVTCFQCFLHGTHDFERIFQMPFFK